MHFLPFLNQGSGHSFSNASEIAWFGQVPNSLKNALRNFTLSLSTYTNRVKMTEDRKDYNQKWLQNKRHVKMSKVQSIPNLFSSRGGGSRAEREEDWDAIQVIS